MGKSFDLFIQYGARKIAEAKNKEARMSVAFSLIQDNKNYDVDPLKLQMFQETVVVGLNALKHIDDALDNFMKNIYILRLVRARQEQACINGTVNPSAPTLIGDIVDNNNNNHGLQKYDSTLNGFVQRVFKSANKNKDIQDKLQKLIAADDIKKCFRNSGGAFTAQTLAITAATASINKNIPNGANVAGIPDLTALHGAGALMGLITDNIVEASVMCNDKEMSSNNALKVVQQQNAALIHTVTNYDHCMQLYLENLFTFIQGSNGLVTVDITDKDAKVNISKLKNRIDSILSGVKEYISLFRNFMPEKYIDKYVKSDNDVSVFSIEKTLVYDKFDNTKDDDNLTLSFALRLNSVVHKWLLAPKPNVLKFWQGVDDGDLSGGGGFNANGLTEYKPYPYGLCLGELVYKFNKLTNNTSTAVAAGFEDIAVNSKPFYKALGMMTQSGDQVWPQPGYGRIDFDDRDKEFKLLNVCDSEKDIGSGSLIQSINQLMLRLVNVCSEISPNVKTYSTLVNTVCAGPFGNVLKDVSKQSLPDLAQEKLRRQPATKDASSIMIKSFALFDYFTTGYVTNNTYTPVSGTNGGAPVIIKAFNAGLVAADNYTSRSLVDADTFDLQNLLPGTSITKMIAAIIRWHVADTTVINAAGVLTANNYLRATIDVFGAPLAETTPRGAILGAGNHAYDEGVNESLLKSGCDTLDDIRLALGLPKFTKSPLFDNRSVLSAAGSIAHFTVGASDYITSMGTGRAGGADANHFGSPDMEAELKAIQDLLNAIYEIQNIVVSKNNTLFAFTINPETTFLTNYAGPEKDQLLLSSLAYILRTVNASVVKNTSVPSNMTLSLTDVPLYVREQMRANLPVFIHMFDLLNKKAEFLLQFSKLALKDDHFMNYQTADNEFPNAAPINALPKDQKDNCRRLQPGMSDEHERRYQLHPYMTNLGSACRSFALANPNDKDYLMTLLNKIAETTFTLYDSCNNVLQELGDIGVFGQTHEGFLESYERRYKLKPITPYSLYLTMLTNTSSDVAKLVDVSGTADFKRNYAIRGLLNGPVSEEVLPYNAALKIENDYFKFLNNVHDLITHHYNGLLLNKFNKMFAYSSKRFVIGKKIIAKTQLAGQPINFLEANSQDAEVVTSIIEEPNQKLYIAKLVEQFTDSDEEDSRAKEITRNIVDLNVIPFNVNLLMRDIPLTNIYNYSLAFEKFIKMFIGTQNNSNTGKLFVKLMQEPYLDLGKYNVETNADVAANDVDLKNANLHELKNIFIGDDSLGMGRPKFLSDQLFNKVLTQSVYDNRHYEKLPAINTNDGINADQVRTWIRYVKAYKNADKNNFLTMLEQSNASDVALDATGKVVITGAKHYLPVAKLATIVAANGIVTQGQIVGQHAGLPETTLTLKVRLLSLFNILDADFVTISGNAITVNSVNCQTIIRAVGGPLVAVSGAHYFAVAQAANISLANNIHVVTLALNAANSDDYAGTGVAIHAVLLGLYVTNIDVYKAFKALKTNQATRDMVVGGLSYGELLDRVAYCLTMVEMLAKMYGVGDFMIAVGQVPIVDPYTNIATEYNKSLNMFLAVIPVAGNFNFKEPEKTTLSIHKSARYLTDRAANGGSLSYVGKDGQVHHIGFPAATMVLFDKNYEYRFNTTVVRNLFFITNLNRVLRLLFEKTLTYSRNVIKHGLEFTNPSLTEYGQFPMLPNETYGSKQNNKLDRYARGDKPTDFHDSSI